jgi:hypothetical protein
MTYQNLYMLTFFILLFLVGVYLFYAFSLYAYMQKNHKELWVELGSPSFFNNSIANNWKCMKFILGRKYLTSHDSTLIARCDVVLWASIILVVLFFVLGGVFKILGVTT